MFILSRTFHGLHVPRTSSKIRSTGEGITKNGSFNNNEIRAMMANLDTKRGNSSIMSSEADKRMVEDNEYVATACASMRDQGEDNEEDTQMTCDVLCALGSSSPQLPCSMRSDSPVSMDWPALSERKGSKTCPKQLQLPMFLSSKFDKADHSCRASSNPWSFVHVKGFRFAVLESGTPPFCPRFYSIILLGAAAFVWKV
jgi:hypothetical protein